MIMGDFNHPGINWNYLESSADSEAILLLMQDCFLTQHVLEPTRGDNVLDLVLSSQKELINDLKEIGTIKRFYSVYDVYYGLLHFIQPSVITKCGFIPEKRS